MKKIIISLLLFFTISLQSLAVDVMPNIVSISNTNTLGVYQTGSTIVLRKTPDTNSEIVKVIRITENTLTERK